MMIEIKQLTLYKNSGYMCLDSERKRGIFAYLSEGTYDRKNKDGSITPIQYKKIRLADIHVKKHPVKGEYIQYTRSGGQRFSSVGFYPELTPYVIKAIQQIYQDNAGIKEDEAEALRRTGGRF